MVRGPAARFALMLILVVLVATVAGLLARALAPGFDSAADAIWWAFLRLTDPGYLGDDQGVAKATVLVNPRAKRLRPESSLRRKAEASKLSVDNCKT